MTKTGASKCRVCFPHLGHKLPAAGKSRSALRPWQYVLLTIPEVSGCLSGFTFAGMNNCSNQLRRGRVGSLVVREPYRMISLVVQTGQTTGCFNRSTLTTSQHAVQQCGYIKTRPWSRRVLPITVHTSYPQRQVARSPLPTKSSYRLKIVY